MIIVRYLDCHKAREIEWQIEVATAVDRRMRHTILFIDQEISWSKAAGQRCRTKRLLADSTVTSPRFERADLVATISICAFE